MAFTNKAHRVLLSFFLLLLSAYSVSGLTARIGNPKAIIHADVKDNIPTIIDRTILVKNVNNVTVLVTLTPGGDLEGITEMIDNNITLAPGESMDARFIITLNYGGNYNGRILASFRDAERQKASVNLASNLIIIANGTLDPNRNNSAAAPIEDIDEEELEEEKENSSVSVRIGQGTDKPAEDKATAAVVGASGSSAISLVIGVVIVIIIVSLGLTAYFLVVKVLK